MKKTPLMIVGLFLILAVTQINAQSGFFTVIEDKFGSVDSITTNATIQTGKLGAQAAGFGFSNTARADFGFGDIWSLHNSTMSIATWVNFTSIGGAGNDAIISMLNGTCVDKDCTFDASISGPTGQVVVNWWPTATACAGRVMNSVTVFKENVWYHLTFIFVSGGGMNIYVNGTLDNSAFSDVGGVCGKLAATRHVFGASGNNLLSNLCRCILDQTYIFHRTIDASEITGLSVGNATSTVDLASLYDYEAPQTLTLEAFPGNGQVFLDWNEITGATRYILFRDIEAHGCTNPAEYIDSPTGVDGISETEFLDTDVTNDVQYFYCLRATDDGAIDVLSNEANATPTATPDPGENTITLTGRGWEGNAELTWSISGNDTPAHFSVLKGNSTLNLTFIANASSATRSYVDPQTPDTCDFYAIKSHTANNTTLAFSNVLEICFSPPRVPLFGEGDDSFFGEGGRTALGETLGIDGDAVAFLFSLLLILVFTGAGFSVFAFPGAIGGAIFGTVFTAAIGWLPIWVLIFLGVVGFVIFGFIFQGRSE